MKLRVFRERLAEADLTEHVDYLVSQNPVAALRFVDAVEKAFERLSEMPEIGALREFDHPALGRVRMWPIPEFSKYLVFYQVVHEEVRVLRVLHSARDIPAFFEAEES